MFVIGGVSGVMTAAVPADLQFTDTYFVVAHIHYVLIGINLFAVLGALAVWFPKMTGRLLDETLGKWAFWIVFVGFNLAFLPMHLTGLLGMPRRIYTYPAGVGWETPNMITTVGAFVLAFGILLFLVNVLSASRNGRACGPKSLGRAVPRMEHAVAAAALQFRGHSPKLPAVIRSGNQGLADAKPSASELRRGLVLDQGKEALATTALDAVPDAILKMPDDSPAPFVVTLAMSVGFAGLLLQVWWLAAVGSDRGAGGVARLALARARAGAARGSADMTDAISNARSAGRQHRPPRQRLVGHDDADRDRGRAVRLSAVQPTIMWRSSTVATGCRRTCRTSSCRFPTRSSCF